MPSFVSLIFAGVFPVLMVLAALKDLTSYTIPNPIPLGLAVAFVLLAATAGLPLSTLGLHVAAGAAALFVGMALFAMGWIGGGDAKLLAGACLWFGWPGSQEFLLDTALAGGALAFLLLLARGQLVRAFVPAQSGWVGRLVTPGEPAPYGVALAIGALAALPASDWLSFVHTSY